MAAAGRGARPALAEELSCRCWRAPGRCCCRGIDEVRIAPDAAAAAEMLLLRLACVADLPPPAELARLLRRGRRAESGARPAPSPASGSRAVTRPSPSHGAQPAPEAPASRRQTSPRRSRCSSGSASRCCTAGCTRAAHLIRFEPGRIELRFDAGRAARSARPRRRGAAALDRAALAGQLVGSASRRGRRWPSRRPRRRQARHRRGRRGPARSRRCCSSFPGAAMVDIRPAAARAEHAIIRARSSR